MKKKAGFVGKWKNLHFQTEFKLVMNGRKKQGFDQIEDRKGRYRHTKRMLMKKNRSNSRDLKRKHL